MANDYGFGRDTVVIGARVPMQDGGRERTHFHVQKWDEEQTNWTRDKLGLPAGFKVEPVHFSMVELRPYGESCYHGNLITKEGWNLFLHEKSILSTDTAPTIFFDSTHGRIGVGTSNTAATASDTALTSIAGMTGNNWILCGAAPTVTTTTAPSTVVFVATFGSTDGVGNWNEFAIDQGTASAASTTRTAPMLNHSAGIAQGTKATGQTWTATATLSFT